MKVMKTKEWNFLGTIKNNLIGEGYLFQHKTYLEYVVVKSAKIVTSLGFVLILSMRAGDSELVLSDYTKQTHPELSNSFESISEVLTEDERPLLDVLTV